MWPHRQCFFPAGEFFAWRGIHPRAVSVCVHLAAVLRSCSEVGKNAVGIHLREVSVRVNVGVVLCGCDDLEDCVVDVHRVQKEGCAYIVEGVSLLFQDELRCVERS